MKTSVVGYPRIGVERELKFACEAYFKHEISLQELEEKAREIRAYNWCLQKNKGVDIIPSNDFSYYDGVLDNAFLLNVIPERYQKLNLSPLDTYFAVARGYQGEKGDVKALPMKKWFNTNYHYIVPEIDDNTQIKLVGEKPFKLYTEAKELGIETKPVILGAYTFLKLAKYKGSKKAKDLAEDIIKAYTDILEKFSSLKVGWIQFDEPALVLDMDREDIALFEKLYKNILTQNKGVKVLLQTYFGDVRDCMDVLRTLPFDGIGMDFIEGKKSLPLIKEKPFPKEKILFAGIINGKNIWRNDYKKSLDILKELKENVQNIVVSTSCSLLHLPCSLKSEERLAEEYKKHFAFAEEKLDELSELKNILSLETPEISAEYINNQNLHKQKRKGKNEEVQKRVKALKKEDFIRKPCFEEREKIQKDTFKLPLLPTTTIGSFPQTKDVKQARTALRKGEMDQYKYEDIIKNKIASCIKEQEDMGFDVLVHGEFERNDMVEYFGSCLSGFLFTEKAWVQSYGTRCVKPPIIWGDVSREKPMTVVWSAYAKSLTNKPLKGMLTGPVTILNWSFPREDISLKESTLQIALAIGEEVLDLEKAGINIIQVDEAALREKLPLRKADWQKDYLDWAIPAFRLVHSKVKPTTQIHTHMCYSEFEDIITSIDDMDADVITFEASRSDLAILKTLKEKNFRTQVGPGVYDIHSPRVPSKAEIAEAIEKMLQYIPAEKLWINPDCGLKTRGEKETTQSLKNLVKAAKEVRERLK